MAQIQNLFSGAMLGASTLATTGTRMSYSPPSPVQWGQTCIARQQQMVKTRQIYTVANLQSLRGYLQVSTFGHACCDQSIVILDSLEQTQHLHFFMRVLVSPDSVQASPASAVVMTCLVV